MVLSARCRFCLSMSNDYLEFGSSHFFKKRTLHEVVFSICRDVRADYVRAYDLNCKKIRNTQVYFVI